MNIPLQAIAFDAGTQIREAINEGVVADYAERMAEGAQFPPVVLFHDGNRYYLGDGFHRYMAAQRNGFVDIPADVCAGTKEDALWFALGANKANGHRMTTGDKRHAIRMAIETWPERSGAAIAEQVGCSSQYVLQIKSGMTTTFDRIVTRDGQVRPASSSAAARAREDVALMLKAGASVEDIRSKVRVGRDTVLEIKRALGLGVDKSRDGVQARRDQMRAMAAEGYTSRQIAAELGLSEEGCRATLRKENIDVPADLVAKGTRKHDSTRILEHIVMDAENLTADVHLIDFSALDGAQIAGWLASLNASRDKLGAFIRRLMKEQQKHGEAA